LKYPPLHRVAHDHYNGMRLAISECRKRGSRRLGFATLQMTSDRVQDKWMAAYLVEQQSCKPSERLAPYIVKKGVNFDRKAFRQWVASERPDSIIGLPMIWPEVDQWQEFVAGLPGSVEWISLDVKNPAGNEAGIYQNHEEIGAEAVNLLVRLVEHNQPGPLEYSRTLSIEGSWVEGGMRGRAQPGS